MICKNTLSPYSVTMWEHSKKTNKALKQHILFDVSLPVEMSMYLNILIFSSFSIQLWNYTPVSYNTFLHLFKCVLSHCLGYPQEKRLKQ